MATSAADISLTISNDKSTLKTNIQEVVTNYNDLLLLFENFTATDSEAEMAGALSEDNSLVRFLKDKIRATVFADSSTASGEIVGLRSLGVEVNRSGNIIFNTNLYDTAILSNYDDVVTMFTADSNNQSVFSGTSMGLGQDVVEALDDLTDAKGVVTLREATAINELADRESDLVKLEERMEKVYQRYLLQFGTMEKLMATLDSTKDYLTSQFETLAKAYDSN
jgi:flagellar hook-associated protein 2